MRKGRAWRRSGWGVTRRGEKSRKGDREQGASGSRGQHWALRTLGRVAAAKLPARQHEPARRARGKASRASARGGPCVYRNRGTRISAPREAKTIGLPDPARTSASVAGAQRGRGKIPRTPRAAALRRANGRTQDRGGTARSSRAPRASRQAGLTRRRHGRRGLRAPDGSPGSPFSRGIVGF